jgi:6-pyruvoyltetrahydropterin/6-carboxytetrahydropterin synthase
MAEPTVRLTKRYVFAASHRLHSPALTDAQNQATYGKCNNPFGHGHDYELEVTLRGKVDPITGRAVDLEALDRLIGQQVLVPFHHRNLNQEVSPFRTVVPTTENLSREVDRRLRAAWPAVFSECEPRLEKVRIRETDRNVCDITEPE